MAKQPINNGKVVERSYEDYRNNGRKYPALCWPVHDQAGWQPFVHPRPVKSASWRLCAASYAHSNPAVGYLLSESV